MVIQPINTLNQKTDHFGQRYRHMIAIVGLLLCLPCFAGQTKSVSLTYEISPNPPYYLGNTEIPSEKPGITPDLLNAVADKLNIRFTYIRHPWARGIRQIETGKVDGIFHSSFNPKRLSIGVYPMKNGHLDTSRKLMVQSYYLYKRKNSPISWDGQTFSNADGKIGVIIGYAAASKLQQLNVDYEEVSSQLVNLKMLSAGRLSGVIGIQTMNDYYLEKHPDQFSNLIKVPTPFMSKPYFLMFSHQFVKDNPKLAEQIWDSIKEIHNSPHYQSITQRYLTHDSQ